jgi:hypothetical protein
VNPQALGKDLNTIEGACFLDGRNNLAVVPLTPNFDAETDTLSIYTSKVDPVPFSRVHSVHLTFKGEFSPCTPANFQYEVVEVTPLIN